MYLKTAEIVAKANHLVRHYGTRDPYELADAQGIRIFPRPFTKQRGAYCFFARTPYIFINVSLDPVMEYIVLHHELGHHNLHLDVAQNIGVFREFNLFDMQNNRMEYEANIFASQIALSDEEVLDYIESGFDIQQIAAAMDSDINLVALKIDTLISQGYRLRRQDHKSTFLKYPNT